MLDVYIRIFYMHMNRLRATCIAVAGMARQRRRHQVEWSGPNGPPLQR
jgi:hypothetical protein